MNRAFIFYKKVILIFIPHSEIFVTKFANNTVFIFEISMVLEKMWNDIQSVFDKTCMAQFAEILNFWNQTEMILEQITPTEAFCTS